MLHGIFWSAVEKYSGLIVSIIITMVLARLLAPEDFGLIAVVTVIIQFLTLFCTMGASPAIVQKDDLTENDLSSIFSCFVVLGFLLSALLFFSAPFVARFYNEEKLILIVRILSVNLFFAASNLVPSALMIKNLRFRQIAIRTLSIQVITGVISIFVAYKGGGVYSLLISPVSTSIYLFFYNYHFYPQKFTLQLKFTPLKKIVSYSLYQFGFDIFNFFSRNVDKLIIGKTMTASELGYYEKSYRLMQLPLNYISSVINPVMQPVLRTLQNEKKIMLQKYNKIVRLLSTISFPLGVLMFFCSSEIINVFFGPNWEAAAYPLAILSLSLPVQLVLSTSGAIFQSMNSTKEQFFVAIVCSGITVVGYFIAAFLFNTIVAMAWSWTITLYVNFIITFLVIYKKVLGSNLVPLFSQMLFPLVNAIVLTIIYLLIPFSEGIIVPLVEKAFLAVLISCLFTQLSGQYNIVQYLKKSLIKLKK